MYEGLQREAWIHTTHLLCAVHNAHRSSRSDPILKFQDLYPFRRRQPNNDEVRDAVGAAPAARDVDVARMAWLAATGAKGR